MPVFGWIAGQLSTIYTVLAFLTLAFAGLELVSIILNVLG